MDSPRWTPRAATPVAAVITAVASAAVLSLWLRGRSVEVQYGLYVFHNAPAALLLSWLGALVVRRQPGNRVGPVLMVIAGLGAAHVAVAAIADVAIVAWGYTAPITMDHPLIPAEMPLSASVPFWMMNWLWLPQVVLLLTVLPVIFPDGRLPGPRWRVVPWLAGLGGGVFLVGLVIDGWPTGSWGVGETPAGVEALLAAGLLILLPATVLSVVGLGVHWHRAAPDQRRPFQVVGTCVGVTAVLWVATYPWNWLWVPLTLVTSQVLLASYALAAARFRVHDLEPVLTKAAVANGLAVAVTAVVAAAVLAVGLVTARLTDNQVLPFVAVGLVAVAAEPIRRGARRLVDRLVFRLAADRAQVLSTIAASATRDGRPDDLLTGVVDALLRGTGADRVEAWLTEGGQDTLAAAEGTSPYHATTLIEPITSHGERLGELRVSVGVLGDLAPGARDLVGDVARVTGAALSNSRLAAALEHQLGELQSSRRRLVEAQDTARRSVERDLHDGAQAQLIALRLRLAVLQTQVSDTDQPDLTRELADVAAGIDEAVGTLRDLARGLQPPILDQEGVAAALRAHARALPIPVDVSVDGFGRYDAAVESALYFASLEAIQNALRHSGAARIEVTLSAEADEVSFTVADDGCGFDPGEPTGAGSGLVNAGDRLGAVGGRLTVDSSPGRGTRVRGTIARPATRSPERR
jgi:two-component system, NarL family, sensor kinase